MAVDQSGTSVFDSEMVVVRSMYGEDGVRPLGEQSYRVAFRCDDANIPFDSIFPNGVHLVVAAPPSYPAQPAVFSVMPDDPGSTGAPDMMEVVEEFTSAAALECAGRPHVVEVLGKLNTSFAHCLAEAAQQGASGAAGEQEEDEAAPAPESAAAMGSSAAAAAMDSGPSSGAGFGGDDTGIGADSAARVGDGGDGMGGEEEGVEGDGNLRQRMADAAEAAREFGVSPPPGGGGPGVHSLADVGDVDGGDMGGDGFGGGSDAGDADSTGVLDDGEGEMDAMGGGMGGGTGMGGAVGGGIGTGMGGGFGDDDAIEILPGQQDLASIESLLAVLPWRCAKCDECNSGGCLCSKCGFDMRSLASDAPGAEAAAQEGPGLGAGVGVGSGGGPVSGAGGGAGGGALSSHEIGLDGGAAAFGGPAGAASMGGQGQGQGFVLVDSHGPGDAVGPGGEHRESEGDRLKRMAMARKAEARRRRELGLDMGVGMGIGSGVGAMGSGRVGEGGPSVDSALFGGDAVELEMLGAVGGKSSGAAGASHGGAGSSRAGDGAVDSGGSASGASHGSAAAAARATDAAPGGAGSYSDASSAAAASGGRFQELGFLEGDEDESNLLVEHPPSAVVGEGSRVNIRCRDCTAIARGVLPRSKCSVCGATLATSAELEKERLQRRPAMVKIAEVGASVDLLEDDVDAAARRCAELFETPMPVTGSSSRQQDPAVATAAGSAAAGSGASSGAGTSDPRGPISGLCKEDLGKRVERMLERCARAQMQLDGIEAMSGTPARDARKAQAHRVGALERRLQDIQLSLS